MEPTTTFPMVRILTNILIFLLVFGNAHGQKFFFGSIEPPAQGGPPQAIIYSFDGKTNTTGVTNNTLTGVPAGALLVLTTGSGLQSTVPTISSSPSLTWTQRSFGNGNGGSALIYTAPFTAGGSITVTTTFITGVFYTSSCLYSVQYTDPTIGSNSATGLGQSDANATITTTRANSLVFCVSSNFNSVDGGANGDLITFRGSAQKNYYNRSTTGNNEATVCHYTYNPAAIGALTVGWTSPTDPDNGTNTAVFEIKGN